MRRILHFLAFSEVESFFWSWVFLLIISHRSSGRATRGFVRGLCRRNMALMVRRNHRERTRRRFSVKNRSPKATWTERRRAERVQPLEFTPLSDRGRTAVGLKSCGTRRVSTWFPRLAGLNGADPRLVGIGWRWRWRHYIDCPAHAAPRGSPKIVLFLWHPLHPLASRSTGRGKNYLQDMQKRKIFY